VETLLVKPRDPVKNGQPFLTLVSPEVGAAIAEDRAAEADLALQKRTLG
jgi:hypothetical protein